MLPLPIRLALLIHLALHVPPAETTAFLLAWGIISHEVSSAISKTVRDVRRWWTGR